MYNIIFDFCLHCSELTTKHLIAVHHHKVDPFYPFHHPPNSLLLWKTLLYSTCLFLFCLLWSFILFSYIWPKSYSLVTRNELFTFKDFLNVKLAYVGLVGQKCICYNSNHFTLLLWLFSIPSRINYNTLSIVLKGLYELQHIFSVLSFKTALHNFYAPSKAIH